MERQKIRFIRVMDEDHLDELINGENFRCKKQRSVKVVSSIKALLKRRGMIVGELASGNNNKQLINELVDINDILFEKGKITYRDREMYINLYVLNRR